MRDGHCPLRAGMKAALSPAAVAGARARFAVREARMVELESSAQSPPSQQSGLIGETGMSSLKWKDFGCEETGGRQALAFVDTMCGGNASSGEAKCMACVVGLPDEVRGCGEPEEHVES